MKKVVFALILFFSSSFSAEAADQPTFCLVYFTGESCPHCAKVKPVLLEQLPKEFPNLKIIEYEIYREKANAPLISEYNQTYGSGLGIPLVILGKDKFLLGDGPILANIRDFLAQNQNNPCPLSDGSSVDFEKLDLTTLPGKPEILPSAKGEILPNNKGSSSQLTFAKVISLAVVDSINPCALAVLVMILFAIISLGSKKRNQVLFAGLAFSLAVFLMYFFYGLIIVRFFQLAQALTSVRLWLYKFLGILAVVLGILNLKDYLHYRPGGFLTEMPLWLRPKMQTLFFKATGPKGAFVVGLLVTLFLLPCTIGPYIICGGVLCQFSWIKILPWLLLYNLIFILPMLAITVICYLGIRSAEHVADWREKNIKYLHLTIGLIILGLGLAMIFGWV